MKILFCSTQKPTAPSASSNQPNFNARRSNAYEPLTKVVGISLQSDQFQSVKEIARSEIDGQKLIKRLSTYISKESIILSGGKPVYNYR